MGRFSRTRHAAGNVCISTGDMVPPIANIGTCYSVRDPGPYETPRFRFEETRVEAILPRVS